jgi:Domain of unknown function (DUF4148)
MSILMSRSAINGEGTGFYSSVTPSPTATSSRDFIMKRIHQAILVASVLSLPLLSSAATIDAPITRAQVRAELVAAEQAGQYPRSYVNYPDATPDSALTHVANREAAQAAGNASYGPSSTGTFATGVRHLRARTVAGERPEVNDIYRGQ